MAVGRSAAPSRVVRLERLFNVRGLGGLAGADGGAVRAGSLFRSDDPFDAAPADLTALAALGIDTVIDLRSPSEVEARGSAPWARLAIDHRALPLMDDQPTYAEDEDPTSPPVLAASYLGILERHPQRQRDLWRALAEASSGGVLFHCASGRDRTGIVAGILLGFLGVSDDAIAQDFALSARGMPRMLESLRAERPEAFAALVPDEATRRVVTTVDPDAMRLFLAGLRERHGSLDGYAVDLGIEEHVATLRANLITH